MTVSMDEKETVVSTSILYSTYCFIALLLSHTLDLLSPISSFQYIVLYVLNPLSDRTRISLKAG